MTLTEALDMLVLVVGVLATAAGFLPRRLIPGLTDRQRNVVRVSGLTIIGYAVVVSQARQFVKQNVLLHRTTVQHSLNARMDEELQSAWRELHDGSIAYEPSRTMTEGDPELVRVRIAQGHSVDTRAGFADRVWVDQLKVSAFMAAELQGASDEFEIVPLSSPSQALVGPFTDWVWRVTPLHEGTLALTLKVTARLLLSNGLSENHDIIVKQASVTVRANPRWRLTKFWRNNWQWILGSPIVLGALGWVFARALRRKRRPAGF